MLLSKCHEKGIPVHVTRGWTSKSIYAPDSGYRYDGVYTITDVKEERSSRGFRMYRFHMKRIKSQGNIPTNPDNLKLSVSMKRSRNKKATTKKIC